MYNYPIFEVEEMPNDIAEALDACADAVLGSAGILDDQDYVEWPLEMSVNHKRSISDDAYDQYTLVTNFILDELDSNGEYDIEYVIIRT